MFGIILNIFIAIVFLIFWIIAFITLYHLTRFGVGTQPKRFAAIFLFGAVTLFCISIVLYTKIDLTSLPKW